MVFVGETPLNTFSIKYFDLEEDMNNLLQTTFSPLPALD